MKRFVVALLLACIAAFANAEGECMPRVAWVMIGTSEAGGPGVEALRAGLAVAGFQGIAARAADRTADALRVRDQVRAARALGATIPATPLPRAEEVIE